MSKSERFITVDGLGVFSQEFGTLPAETRGILGPASLVGK